MKLKICAAGFGAEMTSWSPKTKWFNAEWRNSKLEYWKKVKRIRREIIQGKYIVKALN